MYRLVVMLASSVSCQPFSSSTMMLPTTLRERAIREREQYERLCKTDNWK